MGTNWPAGPELDELVATRFMELEGRPWKPHYSPEGWYPRNHSGATIGGNNPPGYSFELPLFSTDWGAASEVLAKGLADPDRSIDFALALLAMVREAEPHLYEINNTELFLVKVLRHLNPHTICLAALEASGYGQDAQA
jgi:hypothetical protein